MIKRYHTWKLGVPCWVLDINNSKVLCLVLNRMPITASYYHISAYTPETKSSAAALRPKAC